MKHRECSSSEESLIYFSHHMSHAEGVLCCAFPETSDTNESFQTPDFYGSPCGWAVPPLQQLRPPANAALAAL
jgi:hypothetical protein